MGFLGFLRDHDEMYEEGYLRPLKSYQYRGVDKSPISNYILRPYWEWVTTLFPLWVAPNLITLIGFMLMIFALVLVIIYCPDLETPLPGAFYVTFAACSWIYSTFDNVDGKQARRTGTSSPLGELFDHGCDALNCWVLALIHLAALCMGTGKQASIFIAIFFWGFYLPTWENYHTGILYLGYVNGPTEGMILGCVLCLVSGAFGGDLWHRDFKEIFPSLAWNEVIGQMRLIDVVAPVSMAFFVAVLYPPSFLAVYKECRKTGRSFLRAIGQLSFMALSTLAAYAWLWSPHTRARTEHFILFHVTIGIAFGKMATKIILAHLTKKPFPQFTGLMFPLLLGSVLFNLPAILPPALIDVSWLSRYETAYLWGYLAMVVIGYANWIYHVINSFCAYLDINCLTIKGKRKVSIEVVVDQPSSSDRAPLLTKKQYATPIKPKTIPSKLTI